MGALFLLPHGAGERPGADAREPQDEPAAHGRAGAHEARHGGAVARGRRAAAVRALRGHGQACRARPRPRPSIRSSFFLDEPTSGLDPIGAASFDELIAGLRDILGLTVYMVTHDLDSLHSVCDRVAVLADKKVIRGRQGRSARRLRPSLGAAIFPRHPRPSFLRGRARPRRERPSPAIPVKPPRGAEPWKPAPTTSPSASSWSRCSRARSGPLYWLLPLGRTCPRRATVRIVFPEPVTGLSTGGSVLFNGIRVGEVVRLEFPPEGGEQGHRHHARQTRKRPSRRTRARRSPIQGLDGCRLHLADGRQPDGASPCSRPLPADEIPSIDARVSAFHQRRRQRPERPGAPQHHPR